MKTQALMFIILAATCEAARAEWAYTHWGMTPEQVATQSSGDVKVLPEAERTKSYDDHWESLPKALSKTGRAFSMSVLCSMIRMGKGVFCIMPLKRM